MKEGFVNIKLVVYTNSDLINYQLPISCAFPGSFIHGSEGSICLSLTSQSAQWWEMHISFVRASCPYI